VARSGDDRGDAEGGRGADDGADIVRVGDLIEDENDAVRELLDVRSVERIGLGEQALVHGVRGKAAGDGVGTHQLGIRRRDAFLGKAADGIRGRP
jgi:hypothetical protein